MTDLTILLRLAETIKARKLADANSSYVAKLFHGGQDKILKKIAEESAETLMASKDGNADQVIHETADLWFHCLVLLAYHELTPEDVLKELARREGMSGIEEKASRTTG
ncbi:phosphoribosyl-ATP diphosphatase [Nitrosomonas sp. Nm166]|uniref:phosphoribosyl-ATP diphosphatase n=1 Tax=Nitrosomonas sp. Nm166 TaxID=1881054 RepID=UPI0008F35B2A|nr:phosphoribosyl-ATP diphosphatase [Nitrosomonas sp. Nm166]SFE07690.1 phosphoribosyl-ATP pyrophosphohydrolase [Nitrosomonas sp. Nm166]